MVIIDRYHFFAFFWISLLPQSIRFSEACLSKWEDRLLTIFISAMMEIDRLFKDSMFVCLLLFMW